MSDLWGPLLTWRTEQTVVSADDMAVCKIGNVVELKGIDCPLGWTDPLVPIATFPDIVNVNQLQRIRQTSVTFSSVRFVLLVVPYPGFLQKDMHSQ